MAIADNCSIVAPRKRAKVESGFRATTSQSQEVEKSQVLLEERKKLPIYIARQQILAEVRRNVTTIIIGETGSGKTTQIPQFILEGSMNRGGAIYVTQPRRVAAVSLSMRVADEVGCQLGTTVGYSVRFDTMISEDTIIQYMTDGMLIREAMSDPLLRKANFVLMDEVHERTLHTDVALGIVKRAQTLRREKFLAELKIVVMSATMNVDHFSAFFGSAPVLYVEGRQYPVQIMYSAQRITDYFHASLVTVFQLHAREPVEHDFLVFLTGQDEIEQAVRKIRSMARDLPPSSHKINMLPLYSALTPQAQMRVFQPRRQGTRKIILATNIAETSITIPGVRIVIDSGKVKSRIFEPTKAIDMLRVVNISKAQSCQRAGRAGREASGFCYRLYTEFDYDQYSAAIQPEILRCNLANVILELLSMRIDDFDNFAFMDRPKPEAIASALRELRLLGAVVQSDENAWSLSALGRRMARFPLAPKLSRIVLAAEQLGCLEEALTVAALMSCDSILLSHSVKKDEVESAHRKFFAAEGDHVFHLNVFRAYRHAKGIKSKEWCVENFVHQRNAEMVEKVRGQLRDICVTNNMTLNSCGTNMEPLRKALCYGLFLNSAELDPAKTYKIVDNGLNAMIHPSSCLFQHIPGFVVYNDLTLTNQLYLRDVTLVDPRWLIEAAPDYFRSKHLRFT